MRPTNRNTVVIGLGNPLMGDDGLGIAAVGYLADTWTFDPPVSIVDGGTWGMSLLPTIEDADQLLLIDAIDANREPGALIVLEGDEFPRFLSAKLSVHQIDLRELIALAGWRQTLPERAVAIGLQPKHVALTATLSPAINGAMEGLVTRALAQLETWGHEASRRPHYAHA